tara:strand:- start:3 stop:245 length:243 start_codon:yes stop_codon:yes gene_type:complete
MDSTWDAFIYTFMIFIACILIAILCKKIDEIYCLKVKRKVSPLSTNVCEIELTNMEPIIVQPLPNDNIPLAETVVIAHIA